LGEGTALVQPSRNREMPLEWCKIRGIRRKEFTRLWSSGESIKKQYTLVVDEVVPRKPPIRSFFAHTIFVFKA